MAFDYRQEYHKYKEYYLKARTQPVAQASLTLLASLVTVVLLGIFAIKPTLTTIARLTKELEDKGKVNKQLELKARTLRQAQADWQTVSANIPLVETALPRKPEFVRLEREVEFLALGHQVLLASGGFSEFLVLGEKEEKAAADKDKPVLPAQTIRFTVTVAGTYEQIKGFLADLETLDRVITIESVHFSKETEIEGADLQATLVADAYYKQSFEDEVK
jgi:Tfp pilus assembly protein PilO